MFGNRFIPACDKKRGDEEGEEEEGRKGQKEMTPCNKQMVKPNDSLKGYYSNYELYFHKVEGITRGILTKERMKLK